MNLFQGTGAVLGAVLAAAGCAFAATVNVSSVAELNAAAAKAAAGDEIILKNGSYSGGITLSGGGSDGKPVVVRAETAGQAVFGGASSVDFTGDWFVLEGFHFKNLNHSRVFVVFADGADNNRFTNSAITDSKNGGDRNWIHMRLGQKNRIDHCRFSGMNQAGMQIQIETSPTLVVGHSIDNVLFMDRARGSGNGFETIRVGYSHQQNNNAGVTFRRNLFLRCNGENEILSNKSTGNLILQNTFKDNSGEYTCRHGDKARIEGNFFLNQDRGIRLVGSDHLIVNNYIANMRSDGITLYKGESNPPAVGYEPAHNATIIFNTIVSCPAGVTMGGGGGVTPRNVRVANNVFQVNGSVVSVPGAIQEGNITSGAKLVADASGILRPAADSPVKDAAKGDWADVILDIDGSTRAGGKDVGAFEVGGTAEPRKPLAEKDVGPYWMGNVTPPESQNPIAIRAPGRGLEARLSVTSVGAAGGLDLLGRAVGPRALGGRTVKVAQGLYITSKH